MKKSRSFICLWLAFVALDVFDAHFAVAAPKAAVKKESLLQGPWLSQYEQSFNVGFCQKKEYVQACLKSSVPECKSLVSDNLKNCAKDVSLPQSIALGSESEVWGEKLGRCLAPKLTQKMVGKTVEEKCKNLSVW